MLARQLEDYVRRTELIRQLSSPRPAEMKSADEYSVTLRRNFIRIGELAGENREMLSGVLEPLLLQKELIDAETARELNHFSDELLDANNAASLDIPMAYVVSRRLLADALQTGDPAAIIRQADYVISTCYSLLNLSRRIDICSDICEIYRREGMEAARLLEPYCSKEGLASLPDEESREIVLINMRFAVCLYEGYVGTREERMRATGMLKTALALAEDPEIRALAPNYDWRYHTFRSLEYLGMLSEHDNLRRYSREELEELCVYSEELKELWMSDPDYYGQLSAGIALELARLRNRYFTEKIDRETYLQHLEDLYDRRDAERGGELDAVREVHFIVGLPLDYIYALGHRPGLIGDAAERPERGVPAVPLTERQTAYLTLFYRKIEERALRSTGKGTLAFMLEFLSTLLQNFIEVPEVHLEDLCLSCMAALHPPTYVHTMMVSEISRCLCGHLIDCEPERLVGTMGTTSAEEVTTKREELEDFIYHAALCHDFGKISMIDTIFVYGRRLMDFEFDLIRQHPDVGAALLFGHESTRAYADIARGHHKWCDDSAGYPPAFAIGNSAMQSMIDLVTCADCMDAATDVIGRSYNRGKTLDEYISEIEEGSGTRYAPYLASLLVRPEVHADIERILTERREVHYKHTWQLLRERHETLEGAAE